VNELQIKLTGDISALQSALTKAKATIKSFEESTAKESEKGNVGFKRKIGLIESLTNKSKALRTALSQATNENDVARYNQELEQTIKEMTRLNALGRQVQNNIGATSQGFKGAAKNIGSANGVAIEFNRIIQDAPFGLIGIGNNLQQLTANFAQTSKAAGGAGAAIKASLGALISPANLLVLGISAITAAFTAYQMGAFDFLKSNEDAKEGLEELNKEIDETVKGLSRTEGAFLKGAKGALSEKVELDSLMSIMKDVNLSQDVRVGAYNKLISLYPKLLTGLTQEKALTGDLTTEYELLTNAIGKKALASALDEELIENLKDSLNVQKQANKESNNEFSIQQKLFDVRKKINEVGKEEIASGREGGGSGRLLKLKEEEKSLLNQLDLQRQIVSLNETLLTAQGAEAKELENQLIAVNKELALLFGFGEAGGGPSKIQLSDIFNLDPADFKGQLDMINRAITEGLITPKEAKEIQDSFAASLNFSSAENIEKIANSMGVTIEQAMALLAENEIIEVPINIGFGDEQKEKILETNNILADSFASLGLGIASSMNIGNDSLKGFIMTLISSTPKIIAAMRQASAAKSASAIKDKATNAEVATSEGVSLATKAANALGPVGLALLPVFIGGVLALISSGMKGGGGGGGGFAGGGGASAGKAPQIFTNKVSPPSSSSPNFNSGSIDQANAQSRLFVDVSGDNLRFILDRANERAGNG